MNLLLGVSLWIFESFSSGANSWRSKSSSSRIRFLFSVTIMRQEYINRCSKPSHQISATVKILPGLLETGPGGTSFEKVKPGDFWITSMVWEMVGCDGETWMMWVLGDMMVCGGVWCVNGFVEVDGCGEETKLVKKKISGVSVSLVDSSKQRRRCVLQSAKGPPLQENWKPRCGLRLSFIPRGASGNVNHGASLMTSSGRPSH